MKAGQNKYGGIKSWSTKIIHRLATKGGGIPDIGCVFSVVADNGDIVVWNEWGEVNTVIKAEDIIKREDE